MVSLLLMVGNIFCNHLGELSFTHLHGGVAHRLEQAAHNHLVVGSIPTTPTNESAPQLCGAFSLVAKDENRER